MTLSIATPCHENWDNMNAVAQGRYCTMCAKTVIDFSEMSDEEVRTFFINKKEEKVCGRITRGRSYRVQIALPSNIFKLQMPWWKRFLVAGLLVFGATLFSCDTSVKGVIAVEDHAMPDSLTMGKLKEMPPMVGDLFYWDSSLVQYPDCSIIKGDVEILGNIEPEEKLISETPDAGQVLFDPVEQIVQTDTISIHPGDTI